MSIYLNKSLVCFAKNTDRNVMENRKSVDLIRLMCIMYSYTYKIPDFLLYLNDPLITNEGIDK